MKDLSGDKEWKYSAPKKDAVKKRQQQRSGDFDSILKEGFRQFSPKEGESTVRILPATWDDPEGFGFEVWVHYGIGTDNQTYICNAKMKRTECCICDAARTAEGEDAGKLKPRKRTAYYVLNRADKGSGILVWTPSWQTDRDIALVMDSDDGEALPIDHPKRGYDLKFHRQGTGLHTKYGGYKFARNPSPAFETDEEWQAAKKILLENPLPTVLNYYDNEHISAVFNGIVAKKADEDDEKPVTRHSKPASFDDEDDAPPAKPGKRIETDDDDDAPSKVAPDDDDEDAAPPPPPAKSGKDKLKDATKKAVAAIDDDDDI